MEGLFLLLLVSLVVTPIICTIVTLMAARHVKRTIDEAEHRWRRRFSDLEKPVRKIEKPLAAAAGPRPTSQSRSRCRKRKS